MIVKRALEKDGWTITQNPLYLAVNGVDVQIDLGAEQQPIAAEKNGEKIAVGADCAGFRITAEQKIDKIWT